MDSSIATVAARGNGPEIAFSAGIEPTRLSPAYRLGLIVVAIALLFLPW
jgi:hypothetical protein